MWTLALDTQVLGTFIARSFPRADKSFATCANHMYFCLCGFKGELYIFCVIINSKSHIVLHHILIKNKNLICTLGSSW